MPLRISLNRLDEWPELEPCGKRLEAAARLAAAQAGERRGEVSVTFLPATEMQALNRRWLGRDEETDVLAFELGDGEEVVGDVYVAPETARRAAREHGVPPEEELARVVIHGVLHTLGHDHPEGEERYGSPMFRLQEELLRHLLSG